jgi:O-antigen/teichoic acid export membrane protein
MLLLIVHSGMAMAWNPIFMGYMNNKNYDSINSLTVFYAKIVFYWGFFIILFSKFIVSILAPEEYRAALDIVPVIIVSYFILFLYEQYGKFSIYYKKTYINTGFSLIACIVNIGLNYCFIPIYGYKIAAYTTMISFLLLLVLHYLNVRCNLNLKNVIPVRLMLPCFILILSLVGVDSLLFNKLIYWESVGLKMVTFLGLGYFWFLKKWDVTDVVLKGD